MEATETATVKFLETLVAELDGIPLSYLTEVQGQTHCEDLLLSNLGQVECVYYHSTVKREYIETYYDKGQAKTRKGYDNLSDISRSVPFSIKDATGEISIVLKDFEGIAVSSVSRFEHEEEKPILVERTEKKGWLGNRVHTKIEREPRRILGHWYEERVIPLGHELYVLGEVVGMVGNLAIQRPRDIDKPFIVSLSSKEQLRLDHKISKKKLLNWSISCGVIGVILILIGRFGPIWATWLGPLSLIGIIIIVAFARTHSSP